MNYRRWLQWSRLAVLAIAALPTTAGFRGLNAQVSPQTKAAPKPLFRDPVHDGAADPTIIWNRKKHTWWMFYTNRRADMPVTDPRDVAWVHGTAIGIAESADGGNTWKYIGTAAIPCGKPDYTFWAPDVVDASGLYHMYVTVVPGTFHDWNAAREIVHATSKDLEHWKIEGPLTLSSDRVIDPGLFQLADGSWRMWFKDEKDHSYIHYADSRDLSLWTPAGVAVNDRSSEGPKVFRWKGKVWLIVDAWKGFGVYSSDDATHWVKQEENILGTPGTIATDKVKGNHCDVVVSDGRAYIFYFTAQEGANRPEGADRGYGRRTVIQVAELELQDGKLTVDRDKPVQVKLATR